MPQVLLKTGETVEVPWEELADYMRDNADLIQPQESKRQRRPMSPEAREARRPPNPIDLMGSIPGRLPDGGEVILRKPLPRPE